MKLYAIEREIFIICMFLKFKIHNMLSFIENKGYIRQNANLYVEELE